MNRTQNDNMLRQQQGMPPLGQMPLNSPHFMQNQQQPGQQQPPSARMNLVPNSNSNPAMLGNPQPNSNNSQLSAAQYQLGLQRRQQLYFQQSQSAQMNGSPSAPTAPHMGAPGHNPMQNMGFPGTMIQQGNGSQLRRVASHPQSLNQPAGHVGGMHPGQQGVGALAMGMNPQTSLPAQLRQAQQQQQHQQMGVRMPQMQGPISPDVSMTLGRQPNPGIAQNPARASTSQAQLMASLSQPSSLAQGQSGGGQPPLSLPQSGFQHSIPHQTSALLSSSPRPGNHPQNLNPAGMSMTPSGSSQGSGPRPPLNADNVMFMNFHNSQYSQAHGRIPPGGPQFPFNPSSGSPSQQIDLPQSLNGAPLNSSNPPNRSNFQPTPAQQYEHMQQNENFNSHFNMPPPPANVPPRPPSHPNPHPNSHHGNPLPRQQQPHQHSPHQSDHMVNHIPQPSRPQSQPQAQPGRPSSQAGPSHTPRSSQAQLAPGSGHLSQARIPPAPQPHQSPHQPPHPAQQQPIAPRPPPPPVSAATPSSSAPPSMPSSDGGSSSASRQQQQNLLTVPIGLGQGLIRLLQFSGVLSSESHNKLQLAYWEGLVRDYFMPKAAMKLTLWKDNQKTEARPFDIGVPILPRFFLVTTQSGVKSMTLSLDGARERLVNQHHAIVECVTAVWTYRYINGYTVTLRGPLTAHVLLVPTTNLPAGAAQQASQHLPYVLKFDNLEFHANLHDKYIALESLLGQRVIGSPKTPRIRNASTPTLNGNVVSEEDKKWEEPRVMIEHASIPGEPVNAFGIPQATMRCLELAESVGQMTDLIAFANESQLGPMDALKKFAAGLKENQAQNLGPPGTLAMSNSAGPVNFQSFQGLNGVHPASVTLYSSVPSTNPSSVPQPRPSTDSPQNNHLSIDTPQKNKGQPQSQGSGSAPPPLSSTSSAPTTSQTSANTTPSIGHATLKRKPNDTNSPTTSNAEQPPTGKRATQKRRRTAGG